MLKQYHRCEGYFWFWHFAKSSKPMIVARNLKLPGQILTRKYDLEYGKILFQYKVMPEKFNSFVIVDDLLATGGTVNCVQALQRSKRDFRFNNRC